MNVSKTSAELTTSCEQAHVVVQTKLEVGRERSILQVRVFQLVGFCFEDVLCLNLPERKFCLLGPMLFRDESPLTYKNSI